jgi:hypothetical protein
VAINPIRVAAVAVIPVLLVFLLTPRKFSPTLAQTSSPTPTPTLGIDQGYEEFDTPNFKFVLVKASQTVAALQPRGADGFDFTPRDRIERRASNGYFHLGDLRFRIQQGNAWRDYSTAAFRRPVQALTVSGQTLASADLSPTLPADAPVKVTRSWLLDDGRLVLRFTIRNTRDKAIEISALGIPMIFNNMITGRSLEQAHETCSFADPYIGLDAGYLQVTRLSGHGPALIVVPDGQTSFEAYQLLNEPSRPSQTFEGSFEWVHTRSFADNEWKDAHQWNTPTSATLAPGAARAFGLKFLLSDEIKNIETTLAANNRPVAVGIPGYVLPMDLSAQLFVKSKHKITSVEVEPTSAITIHQTEATNTGWKHYELAGQNGDALACS